MEEMKEKAEYRCGGRHWRNEKWRGLSRSEMDQSWKNLAERMEEEVLDKYKGEGSMKDAFRGRGAPLEWRMVRKSKNTE